MGPLQPASLLNLVDLNGDHVPHPQNGGIDTCLGLLFRKLFPDILSRSGKKISNLCVMIIYCKILATIFPSHMDPQ